ncbi:hypothetical protein MF672_048805 [Actinomadura sp. ATCC 31491]|uniref:Glycosyltransferase family 2 protein n=1 Tax=Actinomadura luzonensis TaxID=2805427 RepID=A0ABT0GBR4_9ACTN|nr:hypothetical protein [Actinomadura luzonensis]MCK2221655.1 hypothetical protein [Actinomadura luzonensis]
MRPDLATPAQHHHGSHRHLAVGLEPAVPGRVDALVVPTVRHPRWLAHAGALAGALGCPVVTLHSGRWSVLPTAGTVMPAGTRYLAIEIGDVEHLNLPRFETTRLLEGTLFQRRTDLAPKRNLGLLLARLMGWRRIMFLDDDIEVTRPEEIRRAASLLDLFDAVGMRIGGFPDNSVVCHAHREAGGRQDTFVGGGALAVETRRDPSFFPNIYNEDWFYLLDDKALRRPALAGEVRQRPYNPYDRPSRARDQELGDVLAEGIYWLLDEDRPKDWQAAADADHWREFLGKRRAFIEDVLARVRGGALKPGADRRAMEESLKGALGRLLRIEPEFCVAYVKAWAKDRDTWRRHLAGARKGLHDPRQAVRWLTRSGAKSLEYSCRL